MARSLCPRGAQPRKRVMLVLAQVSSMKIRRAGSSRSLYACHTSTPSRHVGAILLGGEQSFFEADARMVDRAPDRTVARHHAAFAKLHHHARKVRCCRRAVRDWRQDQAGLGLGRHRRRSGSSTLQFWLQAEGTSPGVAITPPDGGRDQPSAPAGDRTSLPASGTRPSRLTFDVGGGFIEAFAESGHITRVGFRRAVANKSHHRQRGLLCVGCKWHGSLARLSRRCLLRSCSGSQSHSAQKTSSCRDSRRPSRHSRARRVGTRRKKIRARNDNEPLGDPAQARKAR